MKAKRKFPAMSSKNYDVGQEQHVVSEHNRNQSGDAEEPTKMSLA
jgi:hypothetical protein